MKPETADALKTIITMWSDKRKEEALTMCAKRELTEEEVDRAMIIGKWFFGWTDKTGPCPIDLSNKYWHKKLCALFEWIAVLESQEREAVEKKQIRCGGCRHSSPCKIDASVWCNMIDEARGSNWYCADAEGKQ